MTDSPTVVVDRDTPPLAHVPPVSLAASQGTTIEQSRAVAEAQAAVVLAQHAPRSVAEARRRLKLSCSQPYMAADAFYKFKRGGQTIRDLTVDVARELAACWGNIEYGLTELARDDRAGVSEVKAWAWDVETNTRASSTFIVPHRRDRTIKRQGEPDEQVQDDLKTLRDVQDNNASIGGRRLRQALFSVLPAWFREEARVELEATIRRGDGTPLPQRIEGAVDVFAKIGVEVERLEQRLAKPRDRWNEFDVVEMLTSYKAIQRGEVTVDDEFPQRRVTAGDIGTDPPPATDPPQRDPGPAPAGDGQDDPDPAPVPDDAFDDPPPAADEQRTRPTEDELRDALKAAGLKIGDALRAVKEQHQGDKVGTLAEVAAHPEAGFTVLDWIKAVS